MRKAAQLIVFALVLGQGHSAIDDVFRQVQEKHDDTMKSVASGLSSEAHLQSDWCRYKMKDSNRTLVKLHYDMVIDESTYKDAFRKDFKHDGVSCEIQNVDGQTANRRRRAASKSEVNRWPLEIPYQIEEGFGANGTISIMKAMEEWGRYTCLHFVQRTDQYDRIIFSPGEGLCESYVGRIIGPQYISLDPQKCMTLPIILHEIGHAIGLYHEHTREDRDNNVTVNYKHISLTDHKQFDKNNADESVDFNKTYDYRSIMHYGKHFFANQSKATSLEPKDKDYLDIIGEAKCLSFHDVQIVNAMYKCKEKCAHIACPDGAFVGKNCKCLCQGPPEYPVQQCNTKMSCDAPAIDLATYWVFPIKEGVELLDLSDTKYPDGTVLIVKNPRCSGHGTGNYTCQDGKWVVNINCKPDRCVYNTSHYDFKPNINITADGVGKTMDYVNNGTHVHVECIAPKGIPSFDSECRDSLWVPELPNCEAAVDCKIDNFDVRNVEILFKGEVKTDGDVVPDGSSVKARCKGSNQQNSPITESQSTLVCNKGHLKGQIPTQCPSALYACPIVNYATTSGPFNDVYDVKCFDKYEMQPQLRARFQCDWRGVWKPFVPKCIPASCRVIYDKAKAEVKLMDGSEISPNLRIRSGQTISMACTQPGHVPDHVTRTCDSGVYTETGDNNLPLCKLVTCKPPPLSDAVVYMPMNGSYLFKDSVGIQRCKGKLWFQGNQSLTCTAEGTWNGTAKCTPYCQGGTEQLEERQNSDLTKHTVKNITVESYQECLTYCKNYERILCRAFAYGFDQGRRRCHITYVDPSRHTDIVGTRQLWSVWIRKCD